MFGQIFGAGLQFATNATTNSWNNAMAGNREAKARAENYKYGEMAANNADIRTRQLYNSLYSPEAQLKQIKAAGLSPSLFYGDGSGISGQSGAQGTGAAGVNPTTYGISPIDVSQIRLLNAQADKTEAETKTIEETRNPSVQNLLAEAGYKDAAAAAAKASTEGMKLDNYVKEHTQDANIFTLCELADKTAYEAAKLYNEMRNAKLTADLNEELYKTNVEKGKEELNLLISSIKLNDQQREYLRNEVLKSFEEMMQKWKDLDIKESQQTTYTEWIEAQIPMLEKNLEVELKRLGIEKSKLVVNAITDAIKGIGTTAVALSMFKNGNRTTGPNELLKEHGYTQGGNAITPNRGGKIYNSNSIWAY